jgi:hypothetical protein
MDIPRHYEQHSGKLFGTKKNPKEQTENPKITYCIMIWLHMYFKWPILNGENKIHPDSKAK